MYRCAPTLLLLLSFGFSVFAAPSPLAHATDTNLPGTTVSTGTTILIGGGLKLCSSSSTEHCHLSQVDRLQRRNSKQQPLYHIDDRAIAAIAQADWLSPDQAKQGKTVLMGLNGRQSLPSSELQQLLLSTVDRQQWHQSLSVRQQHLLLDLLEQPQTDRYGERLTTQVWLDANRDNHTQAIASLLIAKAQNLAGDKAPSILFMTASGRDPFAAVDRYRGLLGENSHWLPIDASVQAARRDGGCHKLADYQLAIQGNLNRRTLYPKLTGSQRNHCLQPQLSLALINQAQLLFINDGDRALAWLALRHPDGSPTPELTAILNRWHAGKLIIASNGAASALQTSQQSPMIISGSNRSVLTKGYNDQATTAPKCISDTPCLGSDLGPVVAQIQDVVADKPRSQPLGGIGGFAFGSVDSHSSERGRQLRLSQLAPTLAPNRWLLGIDENSAAIVEGENLSVVGENGVWLAQPRAKQRLITHYVQHGDSANLESGLITLSKPQHDQRSDADTPPLAQLKSEQDDYRQLGQSLCASTATQALGHVAIDGRHFGVLLHTSADSQFSQLPSHNWCSYRAVELQYGEITER